MHGKNNLSFIDILNKKGFTIVYLYFWSFQTNIPDHSLWQIAQAKPLTLSPVEYQKATPNKSSEQIYCEPWTHEFVFLEFVEMQRFCKIPPEYVDTLQKVNK